MPICKLDGCNNKKTQYKGKRGFGKFCSNSYYRKNNYIVEREKRKPKKKDVLYILKKCSIIENNEEKRIQKDNIIEFLISGALRDLVDYKEDNKKTRIVNVNLGDLIVKASLKKLVSYHVVVEENKDLTEVYHHAIWNSGIKTYTMNKEC